MINQSLLVPKRAIYNMIGSLCKNPQLIFKDGVEIQDKDFEEKFYRIVFAAINNTIVNNVKVKEISAVDVDNYLSQQVQLYKIYELNNGFEFINSAIENANPDLFEQNYSVIKKFSLLRDFNKYGFDISGIYNPENNDLELQTNQAKNLEKMSMQEIIDYFTLKLINLKNIWNIEGNHRSYNISDGLDTLLEELHSEPDYGYPFLNSYYNAIFRGMRYGKLMIKSAGTGVGKTRTALMDIVSISASHIFDLDTMQWKRNGQVYSTCFISTELDKSELQTCLIAIISGVSEEIIKKGSFSPDIYERVRYAIEVLKNSPIALHYIEDFSIADIEQIIEKDILEKNVKFVFFDYLQITPKLSRTIQEEYGLGLREDQILQNFSARLKNIATRYNVYVSTATQLNRNSKERENRDATSIRGGSGTIDKADHAIQMYKVTQQDLDKVEPLLRRGVGIPNFMHVIYKNRSGRNNIIIWTIMNHGNMREKVLFCTDNDYNPITDIQPLILTFENTSENIFE